jgi:hypothetical protein
LNWIDYRWEHVLVTALVQDSPVYLQLLLVKANIRLLLDAEVLTVEADATRAIGPKQM